MLAADATPEDAASALDEADGILRDAIAALV
jgi:N-acetylmuramic acid 6-phosphate etherase